MLIKQVLGPLKTKRLAHLRDTTDEALLVFIRKSLHGIRDRMQAELDNPSRKTSTSNYMDQASDEINKLLTEARRKAADRKRLEQTAADP